VNESGDEFMEKVELWLRYMGKAGEPIPVDNPFDLLEDEMD